MKRNGWLGAAAMAAVTLLTVSCITGSAYAASRKVDLGEKKRWGGSHGDERSDDPAIEQRAGIAYFSKGELREFDASRGSVEFVVKRLNAEGSYGPLLRFEDKDGRVLLEIAVNWFSPRNNGSSLHIAGANYHPPVWGQDVDLGREVAVGEEVTITMTWGTGPEENRVYMNGKEARAYLQLVGTLERIAAARNGRMSSVFAGAASIGVTSTVATRRLTPGVLNDGENTELVSATFFDEVIVPGAAVDVKIASLENDVFSKTGFSGKLIAGNTVDVKLLGTPGATGTFDIVHYPDLDRKIALDWRGWGVYLEEKVFYEPGEVNLRDVEGYRVYAAKASFDPAALTVEPVEGAPPPLEPVIRLEAKEQAYTLEFLDLDTPYYVAVLAEMRDGTLRPVISPIAGRAMTESAPGVYTGSHQVGYQDRYPRAVVVGHLSSGDAVATLAGDVKSVFAMDPALTIAVATEPNELKADEKSVSKVTITVTDANGNPVSGHKVKFLLATTSQYTGVVGGGAFADQVGGSIKESAFGETDLFGRLTASYVAGFAAKTAVIVARDMASNDTGAGYVKTYIQAAAELELEPVAQAMARMAEGYEITVTSSDEWLTADGKSQARITARVTLGGQPVEGHQVGFEASPGAGSIRVVQGRTDRGGEARAVFTAGKKIGIALITATDTTVGISGSVAIELRSDAPAKIKIQIKPEKLPADGRSRADLLVQVTDINDNPNDNVEVEYRVARGGGSIREDKGMTDRNGESATEYTAGSSPGRVSIEITVRSTVPTEEELLKARGLAVAVTDYKFF